MSGSADSSGPAGRRQAADTGHVSSADQMQRVRDRVADRYAAAFLGDRVAAVESRLARAQDYLEGGQLVLPEVLLADQEWKLKTYLEFRSHRPFVGRLLVVMKRLMLPFLRWLYEYSQENFRRQQNLNRALIAAVEALAVEAVELERRVRELEGRPPVAGSREPAANRQPPA